MFTANGLTILAATITLPRTGVWHADVAAAGADPAALTGKTALSLGEGGLALAGTTIRPARVWRGQVRARVLGGAGGLGTPLPAKAYRYVTGRILALDVLGGAGEQLSAASDPDALGAILPSYARLEGDARSALAVLSRILVVSWRALPDGTVWMGRETWPASALVADQTLDETPEDGRASFGVDAPTAVPGTRFNDRRIGRVVHHILADRVRTELFFDDQ